MVRILHAGDFHLDSAVGALTPEQARQRRVLRRFPRRRRRGVRPPGPP